MAIFFKANRLVYQLTSNTINNSDLTKTIYKRPASNYYYKLSGITTLSYLDRKCPGRV